MIEPFLRASLSPSSVERCMQGIERDRPGSLLRVVLSALVADVSKAEGLAQVALAAEIELACRLSSLFCDLKLPARSPISPTAVVVGLPRTGTTFLQGQLSDALGGATPLGWEYSPTRLESLAPGGSEIPREAAEHEIEGHYLALAGLNPKVHALHPLGAKLPEECTPLFRSTGRFMPWLLLFDSPGAEEILLEDFESGTGTAHADWKIGTVLIGRHQASVLKSPLHTPYVADLARLTNPRTKIVVVRRDARDVVRSFVELTYQVRSTVYEAQPEATSRTAIAILTAMARGFEASTAKNRVDVIEFDALVEDPATVVRLLVGRDTHHRSSHRPNSSSPKGTMAISHINSGDIDKLRAASQVLVG